MENNAIEYVIEESALGALLVAATPRGVCLVHFGEDETRLTALVRAHFPWAALAPGAARLRGYAKDIAGCVAGRPLPREIPLDVRGSRFQERVWDALSEIPHGETRSYALVARSSLERSRRTSRAAFSLGNKSDNSIGLYV